MANHSMRYLFHVIVCLLLRAAHLKQKQQGCLVMQDCFSVWSVAGQPPALYQIQSIIFSPHVVGKWTLIQAEGL